MTEAETRNRRGGHPGGASDWRRMQETYATDPGTAIDRLTVLRTHGRPLTKCLRPDGSLVAYANAKHFTVREVAVGSLDDLVAAFDRLSRDPRCAVIRGLPVEGLDRQRALRRKTNFAPAPRRWLAVDVDGVDEPIGLTFAAEPEAGAEYVRDSLLPPAFENAVCWWQATSSAGIKPGIRARLWFWCNRPVGDAEAKRWLADAPVDPTLYGPVTLHYVAAPIVEPGARDPIARRQGVLDGDDVVVPELSAPPPTTPARAAMTSTPSDLTARKVLITAVERVVNAPEGERNSTLNREAFRAARFVGDGLAEGAWREALAKAATKTGLDEAEVERTLASALRGAGEAAHG